MRKRIGGDARQEKKLLDNLLVPLRSFGKERETKLEGGKLSISKRIFTSEEGRAFPHSKKKFP